MRRREFITLRSLSTRPARRRSSVKELTGILIIRWEMER
jgi:hypothetical protein